MMPRKFSDEQINRAEEMRAKGIRWVVIEKCIGVGIMGAYHYRQKVGYSSGYSEELETRQALLAWNGEGDRQSFIDGYKMRAKKERHFL